MPSLIYLAGFDVFRPDATEWGQHLRQLCRQHGLQGHFPLDSAVPAGLGREALARWILQSNLAAIRRADLVMANLNPFRGQEPDSGTAFEVGYAHALGKPVWAYLDDDRPLAQRLSHRASADGRLYDAEGLEVENFGLPLNLMLACSVRLVRGGPDDCLEAIADSLRRG